MASPVRTVSNSRRTSAKQRRGQHILDVNVRAHQASRQRQQRVFGAFSMALIFISLGAGLFFGGRKLLQRFFLKNPDYNLEAIDVQTDGILSPEAIAAATQLEKGMNIFKIDLDGARARLSVIPEVEKVEVSRQLPNRVGIEVTERKPVAWVTLPSSNAAPRDEIPNAGRALLIDANGIILPAKKPLAQNSHLPIIRGYTGPTTLGQSADGEEMRSALDLLHAHQDSLVAARYQIEEVDLSKHFALIVSDQNGTRTMMGLDDMNKQLKKMESILEAAEQRGRKVQTMNLLVENNTPVIYQPLPPPEPVDPAVAAPAAASPSPSPAAAARKEAPAKRRHEEKTGKARLIKNGEPNAPARRGAPLQPFQ